MSVAVTVLLAQTRARSWLAAGVVKLGCFSGGAPCADLGRAEVIHEAFNGYLLQLWQSYGSKSDIQSRLLGIFSFVEPLSLLLE